MCRSPLVDIPPDGAGADPYRLCPGCAGVLLDPAPVHQSNLVFESPEGAHRQAALEASRRPYFLRHLVRVERRMPTTVQKWRLLEIGCGSGVLLGLALERGWHAAAIEMSPELADLARSANPGADVVCGDVTDHTVGRADYDAVVALDVLEHVLEPEVLVRNCGAQLRRGGLLLLQTPNTAGLRHRLQGADWEMRDPTQHVNLFSPQGLRGLLERSGFAIVALNTISGTGLETGWRRGVAGVKEWVLDRFRLGNALVVVAKKL